MLPLTLLISQYKWLKDKPFLLMHFRHARNSYDPKIKINFEIQWSFFEIFPFIRFGIAWTGQINLKKKLGHDIKYLSIWAFMSYPCFQPKRSQKWHLSSFARKIVTVYFMAIYLAKEDKCNFWDLLGEKTRITHKSSNA